MTEEVVSDQSIEAKLAASFEREDKPTKEPVKPVEDEAEEQVQEEGDEADEAGEPSETQETEPADDAAFEEAEFEGKQYRLPKELKEALLRQKDYTQKTQEVAETRRMLEEREQAFQAQAAFQQQHFAKAVEAHTLGEQLQQFAQVDWDKLADENPAEAMKLHARYVALQTKYAGIEREMQGLNGQFSQQMAETRQKAQAQCLHELKKDFPELASPEKAPVLLKGLDETGRSFGFTGQELANIADPRMIRVLHAAMQYKKLQGAKSVVEKKVQTAKPVQVQASRTAQSNTRNSQLSEMKAKAIRSGKTSDVESFLAARFAKQR